MKKILLISIFIFNLTNSFSQITLFEKDIKLKVNRTDPQECYPVINEEDGETAIFLLDKNSIKSLLFDTDFKLLQYFSTDKLEDKKFKYLLGSSIKDNKYHLFFTNKDNNQFYIKSICLSSGESSELLLPLKLEDEKFLETIGFKNKLYLLTLEKLTSILKIYVFNGNEISLTKKIDFSDYKFTNELQTTLYHALNAGVFTTALDIKKVNSFNPNPLELTSEKNKLFNFNDKIFLSLDKMLGKTTILTIDLNDFSFKVNAYKHGSINEYNLENISLKSNSYLYNDYLFQVSGCTQGMLFNVYNLKDNTLIQSYTVKGAEEISFKNSALIKEDCIAAFSKGERRELENTQQFLKNIDENEIGVSAYKSVNSIEVTIGSHKTIKNSGKGLMINLRGGVANSTVYRYNPSKYSFDFFMNPKSTYFKALIDPSTGSHTEGEINKNAFDRIKSFTKLLKNEITLETIFKIDNYFIYGYYDKVERKYYLRKFQK